MSLLNSIDRDHVLTAMETWDAAGGANYMLVRGGVSTHVLMHHGKEYDAAAIAGIAHGLATGRTLTPADIPGGSAGASKHLVRLGGRSRRSRGWMPCRRLKRCLLRIIRIWLCGRERPASSVKTHTASSTNNSI